MPDLTTLVTLVLLSLTVVLVLAAVFGRRKTRRAAYKVLALIRRPARKGGGAA